MHDGHLAQGASPNTLSAPLPCPAPQDEAPRATPIKAPKTAARAGGGKKGGATKKVRRAVLQRALRTMPPLRLGP